MPQAFRFSADFGCRVNSIDFARIGFRTNRSFRRFGFVIPGRHKRIGRRFYLAEFFCAHRLYAKMAAQAQAPSTGSGPGASAVKARMSANFALVVVHLEIVHLEIVHLEPVQRQP